MIFDKISNFDKYKTNFHRFEKAFEFIKNTDLSALPVGKHPIDGDKIFASVNEYFTKTEGFLEAHRKYIDIQVISEGTEKIGFSAMNDQKIKDQYNPEKDIAFYNGECDYITVTPGHFAIFFPEDLHKPGIQVSGQVKVKKIVVKVQV